MRRLAGVLAVIVLGAGLLVVAAPPPAGSEAFPGLNGKIAFTRYVVGCPPQGCSTGDIWVMDADASDQVNLTNHPASDQESAWSPDGRKIAFSSDRDGSFDVFVMDANGANPVNLTNNPAADGCCGFVAGGPAWSPDGTKIAFASDRDGVFDIFVMDADGSNVVNLTSGAGGTQPSWSPDGTRIAFRGPEIGDTDDYEILMMDADGSNRVTVTTGWYLRDPSWSPDGSQLAYSRYNTVSPTGPQIFIINADGTGEVRLTTSSGSPPTYEPAWSPDGTAIAYQGWNGHYAVIVRDLNGSYLAGSHSDDFLLDISPSWQPVLPPSVSVGSAAVVEGDSGKKRSVQFAVTLSEPATTTTKVGYRVQVHGSAEAPDDVVLRSGFVTFKPAATLGLSSTVRSVTTLVAPDVLMEGDESFSVTLTGVTGLGVSGDPFVLGGSAPVVSGSANATGTILDDDPPIGFTVSVGDASIWEGDVGQKATSSNNANVWVNLSEPATTTVSVRVTVTAGSASAGSDFKKAFTRVFTFKPGQWQRFVAIPVVPDIEVEGDETLVVTLSDATGGLTVGREIGTATILNDD
jgi:hypothetical protein